MFGFILKRRPSCVECAKKDLLLDLYEDDLEYKNTILNAQSARIDQLLTTIENLLTFIEQCELEL